MWRPPIEARAGARRIAWADLGPLAGRIEARGIAQPAFAAFVERTHAENVRRVREGDLDHLVFYLLQSTRVSLPAIEPALSARAFVEGLPAAERDAFLKTAQAPVSRVSADVRSRVEAMARALASQEREPRLDYMRQVASTLPAGAGRVPALLREYVRAMRFVYEKEFVAQRSTRAAEAVADLYHARGLSTDTAVEAGYLVYLGLGIRKALAADRPIRRVLIIGPGLDLAPRTSLVEAGPPASYQPWAVIDALVALGLSTPGDLEVVAADINPRVVSHLRAAAASPPGLMLLSEMRQTETISLSPGFRDYFASLGQAVGDPDAQPVLTREPGHLAKRIRVKPALARALHAEPLDIVTERLDGAPFDLAIATNILPYFDDTQLALVVANIAAMLGPGGALLHNEPRPLLGDLAEAAGLHFEQSRHAVIATVSNAPAPLGDSVFLHVKK